MCLHDMAGFQADKDVQKLFVLMGSAYYSLSLSLSLSRRWGPQVRVRAPVCPGVSNLIIISLSLSAVASSTQPAKDMAWAGGRCMACKTENGLALGREQAQIIRKLLKVTFLAYKCSDIWVHQGPPS